MSNFNLLLKNSYNHLIYINNFKFKYVLLKNNYFFYNNIIEEKW